MSILDHKSISGRYLFPQDRKVDAPFTVDVGEARLECFHRVINTDAFTIVHFHGNGEAVADYVPALADVFEAFGLNSLFVEYREYGGSTGTAQLVAMLPDGEAVLAAADVRADKAIVFGRSVGSLYAIELVARQPKIAGLIIESGIADPAERFLKFAELESFGLSGSDVVAEVKQYFNHELKLRSFENPLLVMHTENDGLIDVSHALRNYEWAASRKKQLVRFPNGNHNSIFQYNLKQYLGAVQEFVDAVRF